MRYRCMNYHYDLLEIDYDSDTKEIKEIKPKDITKTKSAYNKLPNGYLEMESKYDDNTNRSPKFSDAVTIIHFMLDTDKLTDFNMYDKVHQFQNILKRDSKLSVNVLSKYEIEVIYKSQRRTLKTWFGLKFTPKPKRVKKRRNK